MASYIPINCSYYDELESIATLRKSVSVVYSNGKETITLNQVLIQDLFTKDKEEFVELSSGHVIRLDHLIEVDGKPVVYGCER